MAASVRIEDEAFSDLRFRHLGKLLGSNEFYALGLMAHLWRACTARGAYSLPREMVESLVDPVILIASGLAEDGGAGGIRIRGTRGRIEWLKKKRKASAKGGLATRAKWRPKPQPHGLRGTRAQVVGSGQILQTAVSQNETDGLATGPSLGPPAPAPALYSFPAAPPAPSDPESQPPPDPAGSRVADRLRGHLLTEKPDHQLADARLWATRKKAWAKQLASLCKRRGEPAAISLLAWVFGDQGGAEKRFRVDSPTALAEKWDRISLAMQRPVNGARTRPAPVQPKLLEDWGRHDKETR